MHARTHAPAHARMQAQAQAQAQAHAHTHIQAHAHLTVCAVQAIVAVVLTAAGGAACSVAPPMTHSPQLPYLLISIHKTGA